MAPSTKSEAYISLLHSFGKNFPQDSNLFLERCVYDQVQTVGAECPGVTYKEGTVAGRPCLWMRPDNASPKNIMLFFHGGGFSFGSPSGHRKLAAHLANACRCTALSVDYRRTPEHPYPAPLDDCVNAYKHLIEEGYSPSNIVLAGDSCGGCLVTSVPLAAQKHGLPAPAASVSLSPLYDQTTVDGGTMDSNESKDLINTKAFVAMLADRYIQPSSNVSKSDPLVSPLYAADEQVKALPPHWISVAGNDMLCDHGERMAQRLRENGVEAQLEKHDDMQHVFEFMAGKAPEADISIESIGKWVRGKLS